MGFLSIPLNVRISAGLEDMIKALKRKDQERFKNSGDVVRIAIIQLYRREVPEGNLRPEVMVGDPEAVE